MFKSIATGFLTLWSLIGGCPYQNEDCADCMEFKYKVKKIGHLPGEIKESSGLLRLNDLFLTHGDSGNDPVLYGFKFPFNTDSIERLINLTGVENNDWEDLAFDNKDRIFIGDMGNNRNNRNNLQIIIYNYQTDLSQTISFSYLHQKDFPPEKVKQQNFDSEGMFWHKGSIYFFSKNKRPTSTKIYILNDSLPKQRTEPYDSIRLKKSFVTSADINPGESEVALLSYGKVLFLNAEESKEGILHFTPKSCKRFGRSGQAESIIYLDNEHLMITNEKGKVYLLYRKNKKTRKGKDEILPENLIPQIIEKEDVVNN